ncbi:MAG: putative aminohydrolase SsnA [Bacteroidetes bacterium]|nr:putative aminohydrolase SsnA [Bacteroidota bacterium]
MVSPLLLTHGTICIPSPSAPRVLYDHAILLEHGIIKRIAPQSEFGRVPVETLDLSSRVILPGFINLHTHLYSTFARGLPGVKSSSTFPQILEHLWWRLDRSLSLEACYYSAMPALLEAIRSGTTTIVDHHASPCAIHDSLDVIARAVTESGLRACLCYEVSDRDGPEAAAEGIQENVSFLSICGSAPNPMLRALFGLHASFTLSEKTLEAAVRAGRGLRTGFHIHVAESETGQVETNRRHGMRVVKRLAQHGVLGKHTIAAHGVHLNDEELELLAGSGTIVAHNPQSNMNNAVGIADLKRMREHHVHIGLGTDAMTHDMRQELRAGIWAQRLGQRNASVGFDEMVHALWKGNPDAASRLWGFPVGELSVGSAADIIALEYAPATPLTDESLPGHLVFGLGSARVDTTIVGGRVLMHGGRLLLDLDEGEIAAKAREVAAQVWARFSGAG